MKETDSYPVYYADCPYCGEQCELEDNPPIEHECEHCEETFLANA